MSKLLAYLNLLDKDSAAGAAHADDPMAAMAGFGLNDAEQAAVMSGNAEEIAKLTGSSSVSGQPPQVSNAPFESS
jgi:hypothetical protein